jgi:hypothetical protein
MIFLSYDMERKNDYYRLFLGTWSHKFDVISMRNVHINNNNNNNNNNNKE